MPVGTVSSSDSNRIAQFQSNARSESDKPLEAPRRTQGVSLSNESTRGDLGTGTLPTASINVTNSTDLNALAEAVALASFGENVNVQDSTFTRTDGGVNIDGGDALERTLTLNRTTIMADLIKARSFNNGGRDALVIDGSRFDAARLIRLYADGESNLRFKGNVQLNSPSVQLAGKTVTIDAGSKVTSSGNVSVFSDSHSYDVQGRGTLDAVAKTREGFAARPRY